MVAELLTVLIWAYFCTELNNTVQSSDTLSLIKLNLYLTQEVKQLCCHNVLISSVSDFTSIARPPHEADVMYVIRANHGLIIFSTVIVFSFSHLLCDLKQWRATHIRPGNFHFSSSHYRIGDYCCEIAVFTFLHLLWQSSDRSKEVCSDGFSRGVWLLTTAV